MKNGYPKIEYEKESKVLSMQFRKGKSVDSDMQGNLVIDYDTQGNVVRIEVYDFNFDSFQDSRKKLQEFARQTDAVLSVA